VIGEGKEEVSCITCE